MAINTEEQRKARGLTLNQSVLSAVNKQLPGGREPMRNYMQQAATGREGLGLRQQGGGGGGLATTLQPPMTPKTQQLTAAPVQQAGGLQQPSLSTSENFSGPQGFTLSQARALPDRGQPGGGLSVIGGRSPQMQAAVDDRVGDIERQIEAAKLRNDPYYQRYGQTGEQMREAQQQRFLEQRALGTDAIGEERPFMYAEGIGSMPSAGRQLRENQLLEQAGRQQRQEAAQGLLGLQQEERMQQQGIAGDLAQEQMRQAGGLQEAQINALGRAQKLSPYEQTLQRERAKLEIGQEQAQLQQQKVGRELFSQLDELEKLADISGFGTSIMSDVNRFGEALGIGGGELASKREAFDSIANGITAGLTKQLTGPLTEKELAFIKAQVPSVNNTEAGNRAIINNLRRFTELKMGGQSADAFIDSLNTEQPEGGGGGQGLAATADFRASGDIAAQYAQAAQRNPSWTPDKIREAAQAHGMTEAQVLAELNQGL